LQSWAKSLPYVAKARITAIWAFDVCHTLPLFAASACSPLVPWSGGSAGSRKDSVLTATGEYRPHTRFLIPTGQRSGDMRLAGGSRLRRLGQGSVDPSGSGPSPEHRDGRISSSTAIRPRARHRGQCRGERVGMRGAIRSLQRGQRTAGPRQIVINAAHLDGPPTLATSAVTASSPNATAD
jgi:hypothetical protein